MNGFSFFAGRKLVQQAYDEANSQYLKVVEAIRLENYEISDEKAINKWREIFGNEFPKYGA